MSGIIGSIIGNSGDGAGGFIASGVPYAQIRSVDGTLDGTALTVNVPAEVIYDSAITVESNLITNPSTTAGFLVDSGVASFYALIHYDFSGRFSTGSNATMEIRVNDTAVTNGAMLFGWTSADTNSTSISRIVQISGGDEVHPWVESTTGNYTFNTYGLAGSLTFLGWA